METIIADMICWGWKCPYLAGSGDDLANMNTLDLENCSPPYSTSKTELRIDTGMIHCFAVRHTRLMHRGFIYSILTSQIIRPINNAELCPSFLPVVIKCS